MNDDVFVIDTHIHLSHNLYNDEFPYLLFEDGNYTIQRGTREQLIERFKAAGIRFCIDPAIDLESNSKILTLAERNPGFFVLCYRCSSNENISLYKKRSRWEKRDDSLALERPKTNRRLFRPFQCGRIGETGLDYHLPRKDQHRFHQKAWFVFQLKLAHKKHLPVVLHIREAHKDAIKILKRHKHHLHGGVCHCFTGDAATAADYTAMGLAIGIGGSLLADSPRKQDIEQAVIQTPLESIVLETDGPYVKPSCPDFKKKQMLKARNTSLILVDVAKRIAELKNVPLEEVMRVTTTSASRLFGINN